MADTTDALLPCPFCGSDEITVREGSTFRWRVAGCGCGAVGPEARHNTMTDDQVAANEASRLAAISEWNTRATPAGSASGEAIVDASRLRLLLDQSLATIKMQDDFIAALGNEMRAAGCSVDDTPKVVNVRAEAAEAEAARLREALRLVDANTTRADWPEDIFTAIRAAMGSANGQG